jgi:adenine/guanine/hypoxanthine permease
MSMQALDRFFGIRAAGSTMRREIIGGVTTFATMSYIVFVQPTVLAACGMPFGSVLVATCLSAAAASILMGLLARYPFALAPGMGENFLFAFTVCGVAAKGGMGFSWQAGLTIVLISGLIFLFLSLFGVREKLLEILPDCLKHAIGPAIGLFIAFIGLQWGGIVVHSPATMVTVGSLRAGPALITIVGVLLIATLVALRVRGGILIGIVVSCGLGLMFKVIPWPEESLDFSFETFFNLNVSELAANWHQALLAIGLFFFLDLFDTVGTLVGVGNQAGFIDEHGNLPRAGRAFFSDAVGTCLGALFGTSTVTTYIESATGVAAGARTGLAAVTTGICFLGAIALAPVVHVVGQNIGPVFYEKSPGVFVAMYPAVAPALIVVGFLMMSPLRRINWDDVTESLPAFMTIAMMVFGYGITEGIAMGCISFAAIKTATGRFREVHPVMYIVAVALVLRYAFLV